MKDMDYGSKSGGSRAGHKFTQRVDYPREMKSGYDVPMAKKPTGSKDDLDHSLKGVKSA